MRDWITGTMAGLFLIAAMALAEGRDCWTVSAAPARVIDGDTFKAEVKIWINLTSSETIRVLGVDTPERGKEGFSEATLFTKGWLSRGPVEIYTCGRDSFGRLLGKVYRDESVLAEELIKFGYGVKR